jgi:glycosidase
VIQINHNNPEQQDAMIEAMSFWIRECNIDGFRADLAHLTPLSFWIKARQRLDALKPGLTWLAETEEPSYHQAFDISFTWKWMHATEDYLKTDFDRAKLREVLASSAETFKDELRMYYTSNHDENSWNGSEYEKYGVYAAALAVFANTYVHSVPLIYSGQELPCKKRLKFFDKDEINWNGLPALHGFYALLLQFRKRHPVFKVNSGLHFIDTSLNILAYSRQVDKQCILVVLNVSREGINDVLEVGEIAGEFKNIFTAEMITLDKQLPIQLAPGEFQVFEKVNA